MADDRTQRTCGSRPTSSETGRAALAADRHARDDGPDLRGLRQPARRAGGPRRRRDLGADAVGPAHRCSTSGPARAVITEAMRLSPAEPSFLDMRNAILRAHEGDDGPIWEVFAARGMGYFASTDGSTDIAPVADANAPPPPGVEGTVRGTVRDDDGQPLAGAHVGIAGHDTQGRGGLGPQLADDTDSGGGYQFGAPAGPYPLMIARRTGHRESAREDVVVTTGEPVTRRLHARARLVIGRQRRVRRALHRPRQQRQRLRPGRADRRPLRLGLGQRAVRRRADDRDRPRRAGRRRGRRDRSCGRLWRRCLGGAARLRGAAARPVPTATTAPLGLPARSPPAQGGALRDLAGAAAPRVRYVSCTRRPRRTRPRAAAARSSSTSPSCTSPRRRARRSARRRTPAPPRASAPRRPG